MTPLPSKDYFPRGEGRKDSKGQSLSSFKNPRKA